MLPGSVPEVAQPVQHWSSGQQPEVLGAGFRLFWPEGALTQPDLLVTSRGSWADSAAQDVQHCLPRVCGKVHAMHNAGG